MFEGTGVHVIVASETSFKSYVSNKSVEIEGYYLLRNDRLGRRSGGVAVYVRNGLRTNVVGYSEGLGMEHLFVEFIFPSSKILLSAIYKAPGVDEIDVLDD